MDAAGQVEHVERLLPGGFGHALAQLGPLLAHDLVLLRSLGHDAPLDVGHHPVERLVVLGGDGPAGLLLVQDVGHLGQQQAVLGDARVNGRVIQAVERFRRRLGQILDVDAPAGQLGRQTGVLTLAADGQRKLVVGHNDHGRLALFGVLLQKDVGDTRRAEGLGDEDALVGVPFDDVDLLVVEFADDALNTHAAHADAGPHGVHAVLQGLDGDLGALARLAGDALDLHLAVVDFRYFEFQQAAQQVAVVAADDDLGAAAGAAHFQHVDANLVVGAVALALHLLALGQHGFGAAQPDGDVLAADALYRTVDQLALAAAEVLEQVLALGLAHALEQDLLGRLGGDAAEALGGAVDHDHVAQFGGGVAFRAGVGQRHLGAMIEHVVDDLFLGEDCRRASARIDLHGDALVAAQVRVAPVSGNKGGLQRFVDVLFGQAP